jgi:hypothetical protein
MSRRVVPLLTLAILGALTLSAIIVSVDTDRAAYVATGRHPTTPHQHGNPYGAPEYGFGGYSSNRPTTEIGAQWRVPLLSATSIDGSATTWIAVQNAARQFIQLGTFEYKNNGLVQYQIFWSDVTVNFHPQNLLEVQAGDLIAFKMVQVPRGWRLSFDDRTDNEHETITVPYADGASFQSAQWIQEDPTVDGLSRHLTYPAIAPPTFVDMTLDNRPPQLLRGDGQVLSTADHVFLVPTMVHHNQFTFTNATGPARQYLQDVFAFNAALYPFQIDVIVNRSPTKTVVRHIRATLASLETNLRTQSWPANVTTSVKAEAEAVAAYAKLFRHFTIAPKPLSEKELQFLQTIPLRYDPVIDELRSQLGLPPAR